MKLSHTLLFTISLAGVSGAEPSQLPELVVEAAAPRSKTVPTAEQSREELAKVPGGTEVVDAERYLQGRASTMADTFALSPGVVAQPRFGSDEARLSIRGSGMQRTFHGRGIRLMQDGVPLNLADGGFDMQAVDPLATNHIEILRGGNALSAGASTLGGAIDYISATGLTAPGGSARLEAGSFDYLRARVAAGFHEGAGDAYFSLSEQYQEGFRDHAEQNSQRFFSNFGWQLSDSAETRLFVTAVSARSELPGNLTKAELEDDPSQADESLFGAVRYDNRRDFDLFRIADKTTLRNGNNTVEFTAAYTYKDLDHPITPFAGVIDNLSHDFLFGGTFTNDSQLLGRDNRVRAGVLFTEGSTDAATYKNQFGSRGPLTASADQTATNIEGFVEDQLALGNGFTGILGATAASNRRENEQHVGGSGSYDRSYEDFSPKAGVRWDAENFQIFGNVSGSYEPPSFSEAANSSLTANKAQTATTVEIGTRGSHANFRWDATAYASQVEDEFLALNDSAGTPLGTTNADETIHQGLEIFGEADLLGTDLGELPDHRLYLRGAWTYGRFKFDDDNTYGDNTIAGLPPHLIRGELVWENKAGYYAGPTVEWVPVKAYVDHANTLSADPYALLGFKIGRRQEKGLSWFIEAKNLTDEEYAATTSVVADAGLNPTTTSRSFLPGDGRSVFAGLEWKW
ncbi:TonB-dependent receptor [Luteolibacter yonseiensis]|uniref:TonB-dependent receptor n=1 Tax=Luteolibacter yonseiensis TaxID=1144680 RepID=A0A934R324_9BACT|nr:TonB-dependent receptor [Luteolibacter yonseiensis]MBK1815173.1 TonB-dependent receptor [Luteolibacter yonseiensis]